MLTQVFAMPEPCHTGLTSPGGPSKKNNYFFLGSVGLEHGEEVGGAAGVDDARLLRPTPPRGTDGIVKVLQLASRVRVDRQGDFGAVLARDAQEVGAEVEPVGRPVALDGHAALGGERDQLLPSRRHRVAITQVTARRMAPDAA